MNPNSRNNLGMKESAEIENNQTFLKKSEPDSESNVRF